MSSVQRDLPTVGNRIRIRVSGNDVHVEVSQVPAEQPLLDHGIVRIRDQHDDETLIQREGGAWVTLPSDRFRREQLEVLERTRTVEQAKAAESNELSARSPVEEGATLIIDHVSRDEATGRIRIQTERIRTARRPNAKG